MKVEQVVRTVEHVRIGSESSRTEGVNQVSKSKTRGGEEARDHQDESAKKENPTLQEKSQSRDQADGNSPDSKVLENQYIDQVIDVTVVSQRQVPAAQTVHRQWRLTRYSDQHLREHAEGSADGAEVR